MIPRSSTSHASRRTRLTPHAARVSRLTPHASHAARRTRRTPHAARRTHPESAPHAPPHAPRATRHAPRPRELHPASEHAVPCLRALQRASPCLRACNLPPTRATPANAALHAASAATFTRRRGASAAARVKRRRRHDATRQARAGAVPGLPAPHAHALRHRRLPACSLQTRKAAARAYSQGMPRGSGQRIVPGAIYGCTPPPHPPPGRPRHTRP